MRCFREISPADQPIVAQIVREAFAYSGKRFGATRENCPIHPSRYSLEQLRREIAAGRRFYVIEEDDDLLGCVALGMDGQTAEISRLAVDPHKRHAGLGSALLDGAIKLAAEHNAGEARVFVFARHPEIIHWLSQRQFVATDAFLINDVPQPVCTMVRALRGDAPPHVRLLGPGDEAALDAFLCARSDSSAMLISNLRKGGIVNHGQVRQASYMAGFRDGRIAGVIALCWNGTLLTQAPDMIGPIARTLAAMCGAEVEGVIGLEEQVQQITQVLSLPGGKNPAVMMDSHEILYGVSISEMLIPQELSSGRFQCRRVEARDVPLLTDWMMEFNIESLNRRLPRAEVESNLVRMAEERDNRWVLLADGTMVSTSGFNAEASQIVQVGGVYTPPELRGRRYARSVVAGSLLEAQAAGVNRCVLFTATDNIPAQRAYEAIGFSKLGDYRLLLFHHPIEPRLAVPFF